MAPTAALARAFRAAARGDGARVLIDGWHLLEEALAAGLGVEVVAVERERVGPAEHATLSQVPATTKLVDVSATVMRTLSPVRTPSGVAAIAQRRVDTLNALIARALSLLLVADTIQDPGNVGAMVRTAEAAGGDGVIFTGASADAWGWKALRAGMGSTFRLPVVRHPDVLEVFAALQKLGIAVLAATPRGGLTPATVNLNRPIAFALGGEGEGLPPAALTVADDMVSIAMHAPVESLNVAVASGVLLFEARRQRAASVPHEHS